MSQYEIYTPTEFSVEYMISRPTTNQPVSFATGQKPPQYAGYNSSKQPKADNPAPVSYKCDCLYTLAATLLMSVRSEIKP